MKRILTALIFALVAMLHTLGFSQANERYRLQPDDVLRIQVYAEQQINTEVPIGKDGYISAPFAGSVLAQGKTTSELEAELVALYKKNAYIRNPLVSVTIVRYREIRAYVTGFVARPGFFIMRPGDTIVALMSNAGGALTDQLGGQRGDLRRVMLRRSGSKELIPIDYKAIIDGADTSQIYNVEDGDELIVPEFRASQVSVWGFVQRPGPQPFRDGSRLADALTTAGGEIRRESMLSKVMVIRQKPGGGEIRYRCNMSAYFSPNKPDLTQNIALMPGDIVVVPSTKTPNINELSSFVNSAFFLDRLFRDGIFGIRIFR